jgi:YidC/Oxa1 family membrane protein insertase
MIQLYNTIFYDPLFNLLIWLYNIVPGNDIGIAIIILTLLIRVVLFPLYYQSIRSQRALQEIQPKVNELKNKYKDEKEKMSKELMVLYKNEKVNPFSSCLPLVIQFPFLIAVYQVFRSGLNSDSLDLLYPFITNPGHLNSVSFGFIDLAVPSVILAFLAGSAQFWQAKMMVTKKPPLVKGKEISGAKDEKMMATMNKQMVYFMPFITVIIGVSLPAGLTLYWFITTLLMALQQLWMFKKKPKPKPIEPMDSDIEKKEEEQKKTIIDIGKTD